MIKLIASDLDGTLLGPDVKFSPRLKAAIAQAHALGVIVTLATGRGPLPTEKFAEELNIKAPLICFQGAMIYDHQARQVLFEKHLDDETVAFIVRLAKEHHWNLHFEAPINTYLPSESTHPQVMLDLLTGENLKRVDNFLTDLPEVPYKFLLTVHDPVERDALAEEVRGIFRQNNADNTIVPSHAIVVEGLPTGINKSKGLEWLARHYGLAPAEIMTIGDNDNDIEMLQWAGVGVAMGNASPAAKAAADWIAPPVTEDGAAVAIEKYVLKQSA